MQNQQMMNQPVWISILAQALLHHHNAQISKFVVHTGADGGGARLVTEIACQLFNKMYSNLSPCRKAQV